MWEWSSMIDDPRERTLPLACRTMYTSLAAFHVKRRVARSAISFQNSLYDSLPQEASFLNTMMQHLWFPDKLPLFTCWFFERHCYTRYLLLNSGTCKVSLACWIKPTNDPHGFKSRHWVIPIMLINKVLAYTCTQQQFTELKLNDVGSDSVCNINRQGTAIWNLSLGPEQMPIHLVYLAKNNSTCESPHCVFSMALNGHFRERKQHHVCM